MDDTLDKPFYRTPLGQCLLAGDINGVMDVIDGMSTAERAAALAGVHALTMDRWKLVRRRTADGQGWENVHDADHANRLFRAVTLARFLCNAEHPQADYWMHIGIQDIAAFQQRYKPQPPQGQALQQQLRGEHGWHYRRHVHCAVVAGLLPRPDTEEYLDSLFFGDLRQESNVVLQHVDADPDLASVLLCLFEREGASDTSFAAVEKYCHDPALHWNTAFLTLCQRGVYTRAQLLDKTLGALACDWPQFKSGWFTRFHASLAPDCSEMAPYAERYLALCHSRIAPTVTLAADAVATLYRAGAVAQGAVLEALQPVLSSATKAHVLVALDLLGLVVKDDPAAAHHVSALAVHALAHTGADVQKKVLVCLQRWGLNEDARQVATAYLPLVAAANQAALHALLDTPDVQGTHAKLPRATASAAPPFTPIAGLIDALNASRSIAPITTLAELIDAIAHVLENPVAVHEWERAADALVRMSPLAAREHAAFAALKKRAKRLTWADKPLPFALAQLMACALGEAVQAPFAQAHSEGLGRSTNFVAWRTHSLLMLAQRGLGLPPLSTPTHHGALVDPTCLQERVARYVQAGVLPDPDDLALAHLRAPAGQGRAQDGTYTPALRWSVSSSDGEYVFHSLHIHAEPPVSAGAADDIGTALTAKLLTHGRWQSEQDAAAIHFLAALRPGYLDAFYAEGAHALGNNLDWWEACWQNRAYVDVLLQSTDALTPMAQLLLAVALAGKEPGQTAWAVDATAQCLLRARVTPQTMGNVLAALWATPLVKGPRLAKSLAGIAQAHATLPLAVYPMLCAMVVVNHSTPRKDCAPLLELMLELQLAHHQRLPDTVREVLAAQKTTGKAREAIKGLLG